MKINSIAFQSFRNIDEGLIEPINGVNILYGDNAQGKTNIIEGIWLLTGERSFRYGRESELVTMGIDPTLRRSYIHSFVDTGEREEEILYSLSPKKQIEVNGIALPSQNALVGKIKCVVFSPTHLSLIKEGPAHRRDFIDAAICQLKPRYSKVLSDYLRVITQRNSLLRDIIRNPYLEETLDIWDSHLVRLGKIIMATRGTYIEKLAEFALDFHSGISGCGEKLDIKYNSASCDTEGDEEEKLRNALLSCRKEDIRTGTTCAGPHRDDIDIKINGISARNYASQGQQRSAVLALKLAECEMIYSTCHEQPIVLLDDVMSELDFHRREYLLAGMGDRQIFITGCDKSILTEGTDYRSFYVEKGTITAGL